MEISRPTHSPDGYLLCPYCGQVNQRISKASPIEYAPHPKCLPAYKRAQKEKFKRLRERLALVTMAAVLLVQFAPNAPNPPGPGQPVPFDPYYRQVPAVPPAMQMQPYRQPLPPVAPLRPVTPLPPLQPERR